MWVLFSLVLAFFEPCLPVLWSRVTGMTPRHCQRLSGRGFGWSCASGGPTSFGKISGSAILFCSSTPTPDICWARIVCENIILGFLPLLSSAYFPSCIFHNVGISDSAVKIVCALVITSSWPTLYTISHSGIESSGFRGKKYSCD